jgi:hypothetical protein
MVEQEGKRKNVISGENQEKMLKQRSTLGIGENERMNDGTYNEPMKPCTSQSNFRRRVLSGSIYLSTIFFSRPLLLHRAQ